MRPRRILHVLSQRPGHTGSGVTLDCLVRAAARRGHEQAVLLGTPVEDPSPRVGELPPERVSTVTFGEAGGDIPFPLPGMSDVMPYPSSRWSELTEAELARYRQVWTEALGRAVHEFDPDLVHVHHVWLLASLVKSVAPALPVVDHCHGTGLRQRELCPRLAEEVRTGCARNDRFLALHDQHADRLAEVLGLAPERIRVVGAGYREEIFRPPSSPRPGRDAALAYAGKLSRAKGLPWLLDAFERVHEAHPEAVLHVAGSGGGEEAELLRRRLEGMAPRVVHHGMVGQEELAWILRGAATFVLPSFYEGLPLVLVEAAACGCRLVATDLPGVRQGLRPALDPVLETVALPGLIGPDEPLPAELPAFVERLVAALDAALGAPAASDPARSAELLRPFTWEAVFERVEAVWQDALAGSPES